MKKIFCMLMTAMVLSFFATAACFGAAEWEWEIVEDKGESEYSPWISSSSASVDKSGNAHVSWYYQDMGSSLPIKYASNVSGEWLVEAVDTIEAGVRWEEGGPNVSLAVDSSQKAHIVYFDWASQVIEYASNASGAWKTEVIANFDGMDSYDFVNCVIAVDSLDNVYILYAYEGLKLAKKGSSGGWSTEILDADSAYMEDMAIDSSDKIHIVYEKNYSLQ